MLFIRKCLIGFNDFPKNSSNRNQEKARKGKGGSRIDSFSRDGGVGVELELKINYPTISTNFPWAPPTDIHNILRGSVIYRS